jgi:hypothetical protein
MTHHVSSSRCGELDGVAVHVSIAVDAAAEGRALERPHVDVEVLLGKPRQQRLQVRHPFQNGASRGLGQEEVVDRSVGRFAGEGVKQPPQSPAHVGLKLRFGAGFLYGQSLSQSRRVVKVPFQGGCTSLASLLGGNGRPVRRGDHMKCCAWGFRTT